MKAKLSMAIAAMVLAAAWPVGAHHSFSAEFDANKPITLKGTITKVAWTNPHTWLFVDIRKPNGKAENWAVESGTPNVLSRRGLSKSSLPPGTPVVINAYRKKDGSLQAKGSALTLPDGRTLSLGNPGGTPNELTPRKRKPK